jgi:hypothetical protein
VGEFLFIQKITRLYVTEVKKYSNYWQCELGLWVKTQCKTTTLLEADSVVRTSRSNMNIIPAKQT